MHLPVAHASPAVQALPSSQVAVLASNIQPDLVSQLSLVHGLPSLQYFFGPGTQFEPLQISFSVQKLLSASHGAELVPCTQPVVASQLSLVQGLLSSQESPLPALHTPSAHASEIVHTLPSASHPVPSAWAFAPHLPVIALHSAFEQAVSPLVEHVTTVAGLTLHLYDMLDLSQNSEPLHRFPSSSFAQSASALHAQVLVPGVHCLSLQVSPFVHTFPSSQGKVFAAWTQPAVGSQLSVVQSVPSAQPFAASLGVPTHAPPWHVSASVHALPSSHGTAEALWTQPLAFSHESIVQGLASSHSTALPTHDPLLHESPLVHALPSSHAWPSAELLLLHCPVADWHTFTMHGPLLAHTLLTPGWHAPPLHTSPRVQPSSSLQGAPSSWVLVHPIAGLQASTVHGLPSSQFFTLPAVHLPSMHSSPTVHALASASQLPGAATWLHAPADRSQPSVVQGFPSSQVASSVLPLQSSSMPLQTSALAGGPMHSESPAAVQVRMPEQAPVLPEIVQAVVSFVAVACSLHGQVPGDIAVLSPGKRTH
jgi:hypothetical protein